MWLLSETQAHATKTTLEQILEFLRKLIIRNMGTNSLRIRQHCKLESSTQWEAPSMASSSQWSWEADKHVTRYVGSHFPSSELSNSVRIHSWVQSINLWIFIQKGKWLLFSHDTFKEVWNVTTPHTMSVLRILFIYAIHEHISIHNTSMRVDFQCCFSILSTAVHYSV